MLTIRYFHMKNCPHCVTTKPKWNKLKKSYQKDRRAKKIKFLDTEANDISQSMKQLFDIEGFPTIVIYIKKGKQVMHPSYFEEDRTVSKLTKFIETYKKEHSDLLSPPPSKKKTVSDSNASHHSSSYFPKSRWRPTPYVNTVQEKYPSINTVDIQVYTPKHSESSSEVLDNTDEIFNKIIESINDSPVDNEESDVEDLSDIETDEESEQKSKPELEPESEELLSEDPSYIDKFTDQETETSSETPNLYQYLYKPDGSVTNISSEKGKQSLENLIKSFYDKMSQSKEEKLQQLFESEDYTEPSQDITVDDSGDNIEYKVPLHTLQQTIMISPKHKHEESLHKTTEETLEESSDVDNVIESEESNDSEDSVDLIADIVTQPEKFKECLRVIINPDRVIYNSNKSQYPMWI